MQPIAHVLCSTPTVNYVAIYMHIFTYQCACTHVCGGFEALHEGIENRGAYTTPILSDVV